MKYSFENIYPLNLKTGFNKKIVYLKQMVFTRQKNGVL